jgi:hypothetical protein
MKYLPFAMSLFFVVASEVMDVIRIFVWIDGRSTVTSTNLFIGVFLIISAMYALKEIE